MKGFHDFDLPLHILPLQRPLRVDELCGEFDASFAAVAEENGAKATSAKKVIAVYKMNLTSRGGEALVLYNPFGPRIEYTLHLNKI